MVGRTSKGAPGPVSGAKPKEEVPQVMLAAIWLVFPQSSESCPWDRCPTPQLLSHPQHPSFSHLNLILPDQQAPGSVSDHHHHEKHHLQPPLPTLNLFQHFDKILGDSYALMFEKARSELKPREQP